MRGWIAISLLATALAAAAADWPEWRGKLEALLEFGGVRIDRSGADPVIEVDGKPVPLNPETCRLLVPTGGLKGYESH